MIILGREQLSPRDAEKRRGKWSKALVRHGADPRMALAAVLEIAAEDVQVREAAGPDLPVTANTAPSPRPSNPNPNTAAEPSNAGSGSAAGGR